MDPITTAIASTIIPHALAAGIAGSAGAALPLGSSYGAQAGATLVDTVNFSIKALSNPRVVGALGGALVFTAGVLLVTGGVLWLTAHGIRKAAPVIRRARDAGAAAYAAPLAPIA